MPFVTIGMQLGTRMYRPDIDAYNRKTTVEYVKTGYCLQCGNPFWLNNTHKDVETKFCSIKCAKKYQWNKIREENLRVAYKNIDKSEFTEFYKKYQNFVYSEIFNYESEYHEDLIDRWQDKAIWWFYNIKKWKIINHRKVNIFSYLRKAVNYAYLSVKNKKINSGEVFYDECGIATQQKILGNYKEAL